MKKLIMTTHRDYQGNYYLLVFVGCISNNQRVYLRRRDLCTGRAETTKAMIIYWFLLVVYQRIRGYTSAGLIAAGNEKNSCRTNARSTAQKKGSVTYLAIDAALCFGSTHGGVRMSALTNLLREFGRNDLSGKLRCSCQFSHKAIQ